MIGGDFICFETSGELVALDNCIVHGKQCRNGQYVLGQGSPMATTDRLEIRYPIEKTGAL